MKLTKKGEYALATLGALARVFQQEKLLSLREIAEQEKLPLKFLEQIMMVLNRAHLVRSLKGQRGGYVLSRPPAEITLGEIIRAIDGPLAPILSASEIKRHINSNHPRASLYAVLLEVRDAVSEILDKKTLADVLEKSLALNSSPMYYI